MIEFTHMLAPVGDNPLDAAESSEGFPTEEGGLIQMQCSLQARWRSLG